MIQIVLVLAALEVASESSSVEDKTRRPSSVGVQKLYASNPGLSQYLVLGVFSFLAYIKEPDCLF